MSAATDKANAIGVRSDHDLARRFGRPAGPDSQTPVIYYDPAEPGRAYRPAKWSVHRPGFKTDPGGHWMNYGNKTFDVYSRSDKEPQRAAAFEWASERYGVSEWARSPFGGWHPAEVVARFKAAVKAGP